MIVNGVCVGAIVGVGGGGASGGGANGSVAGVGETSTVEGWYVLVS